MVTYWAEHVANTTTVVHEANVDTVKELRREGSVSTKLAGKNSQMVGKNEETNKNDCAFLNPSTENEPSG